MRIVLVEDNAALARGMVNALRDHGHAVDWLDNGEDGDEFLREAGADLAIVDVNLPGADGFDLVRRLRARADPLPVLMLTARGDTSDRVRGLDTGADDYLVKPFEMAELLARIRALSRRRGEPRATVERIGGLSYDRATRAIGGPGGEIDMQPRERTLFEALLERRGRVAPKEVLIEQLYGSGAEIDANAVELAVSRLRRKLEGSGVSIRTIRGLGYLMDADQA